MFRTLFKFIFITLILTLIIIAVALVAAPHFVRQDQVVAFIQKNVALPGDRKLQLTENVDFGMFPYMHFETAKIEITEKDKVVETLRDVRFGFDFNDIFGSSIDFDIKARHKGITYDLNINILEYRSFYEKGNTPVSIKAAQPIKLKFTSDLNISNDKTSLKNIVLTHKSTVAKGNLNYSKTKSKLQKFEGNLNIDSDNIDDIRRLVLFESYNDKFNLTEGKGKVVLGFNTVGKDEKSFKRNLNSEGSFKISDAAIYGFDIEEIALNPGQIKFEEEYSRKINLQKVDGNFVVNNGVAKLSNVFAHSSKVKMDMSGIVNLVQETLNLNTNLDINLSVRQIELPLKIKGSIKDPSVKLKYANAIKNNLQPILDKKGISLESIGADLIKGDKSKLKSIEDELKKDIKGIDIKNLLNKF